MTKQDLAKRLNNLTKTIKNVDSRIIAFGWLYADEIKSLGCSKTAACEDIIELVAMVDKEIAQKGKTVLLREMMKGISVNEFLKMKNVDVVALKNPNIKTLQNLVTELKNLRTQNGYQTAVTILFDFMYKKEIENRKIQSKQYTEKEIVRLSNQPKTIYKEMDKGYVLCEELEEKNPNSTLKILVDFLYSLKK